MVKKFDIDERLIKFAGLVSDLTKKIPGNYEGNYQSQQIIRSSFAPVLMYAEACGAESQSDFIHKMHLALKELRETYSNLRLMQVQNYFKDEKYLSECIQECNELISIFVASIRTAKRNKK